MNKNKLAVSATFADRVLALVLWVLPPFAVMLMWFSLGANAFVKLHARAASRYFIGTVALYVIGRFAVALYDMLILNNLQERPTLLWLNVLTVLYYVVVTPNVFYALAGRPPWMHQEAQDISTA